MNPEDYRKKIERDILDIIEEKLMAGQMTSDRAREIAKFVLDSFRPRMTLDRIYEVSMKFDDHFKELMPVVLAISNDYEQRVKKIVTDHVDNLIRDGKIDESLNLLKKTLNKERKTVE